VNSTDRARQNGDYVRRLLSEKLPEFAAVLDQVVWELTSNAVGSDRCGGSPDSGIGLSAAQLPPFVPS